MSFDDFEFSFVFLHGHDLKKNCDVSMFIVDWAIRLALSSICKMIADLCRDWFFLRRPCVYSHDNKTNYLYCTTHSGFYNSC